MDPNECLRRIRELVGELYTDGQNDDFEEQAVELADKISALDGWLGKGGFLPKDWEKANGGILEKLDIALEFMQLMLRTHGAGGDAWYIAARIMVAVLEEKKLDPSEFSAPDQSMFRVLRDTWPDRHRFWRAVKVSMIPAVRDTMKR